MRYFIFFCVCILKKNPPTAPSLVTYDNVDYGCLFSRRKLTQGEQICTVRNIHKQTPFYIFLTNLRTFVENIRHDLKYWHLMCIALNFSAVSKLPEDLPLQFL